METGEMRPEPAPWGKPLSAEWQMGIPAGPFPGRRGAGAQDDFSAREKEAPGSEGESGPGWD